MNLLVRWFRRNNRKILAVVVVLIMLGFVGGTYIQRLAQVRTELRGPVAYYGDDEEITRYDLAFAHEELEILRMLRADVMLRSTQDLQSILLAELLFSEQSTSPRLISFIQQIIRSGKYSISDSQIYNMYKAPAPANVYWLLLRKEVEQAGLEISREQAGNVLGVVIPRLFPGATYSDFVGLLIRGAKNRPGIPEERILKTFSDLLAVLEYARMMCSNENVTSSQMMVTTGLEEEILGIEFVNLDSRVFTKDQAEPTEDQIGRHFDRYKKFFPNSISDENPYGFGYKLIERVRLEYLAVKRADVSEVVTPPTQEEAEDYFGKNAEQFIEQVLSDPNDPNSLPIERARTFPEVAGMIYDRLLHERISARTESIVLDAKTLAGAGFEDLDTEPQELTGEHFRRFAVDYNDVALKLREKYKVKVYTGKTGLLSAVDIVTDKVLSTLFVAGRGQGDSPTPLAKLVFAVDEVGSSELGPFEGPKPRMYEDIGPVKDLFTETMTLLVRVVEGRKAWEPQNIEENFSKKALGLEITGEETIDGNDVFSVKKNVVDDLKRLTAMEETRARAQEFVKLAAENGWEDAVAEFNARYGEQAEANDPNVFMLEALTDLRRLSTGSIESLDIQTKGNPMAQIMTAGIRRDRNLIDRLYSLIPADSNSLETVPFILEFKPDMSFYCLKSLSVKRLSREEYERIKSQKARSQEFAQSQSMAAVHFNPENILKRMSFRAVEAEGEKEVTDVNTPAVPGGES